MRKLLLFFVTFFCAFVTRAQVSEVDASQALQLVSSNRTAIGLSADDMNNIKVSSSYKITGTDIRMVYLQQSFKGIPVYNQMQVLAFKNGQLVSNAGGRLSSFESRVNNTTGIPSLTPEMAIQSALADSKLSTGELIIPVNTKENGRKFEYGKLGVATENVTAELLWVPTKDGKEVRLAWQIFLVPKSNSDMLLVNVDATTGTVIGKDNLTVYDQWNHSASPNPQVIPAEELSSENILKNAWVAANNSTPTSPNLVNTVNYMVIPYPAESPIHPGGTAVVKTNPWTLAGGNAVSLGWHNDGNLDYTTSRGNNVHAHEDRVNNNSNAGIMAISTTTPDPLNFIYPGQPDYTVAPTTANFQQFAITNLFYWNNILHDITYKYGFDEVGGNFQASNQGRGGLGNDYVQADAQDGGGTNNANFATPVDGSNPRMQMYLFTTATPNLDGDIDNGVITHEYFHGVSNRLTGGPANSSCLGNAEEGGEGWSDYNALMLTTDWSTVTATYGFNTPRPIGNYVLHQAATATPGIRNYPYCTNFAVNPLTYANMGVAPIGTEVHNIGEIWCAALWEMTWELIQSDGINPNLFNNAAAGGNSVAYKLVIEGMRLQPCSPGFIDARNAILKADTLFYGATHSCAIITAFARRGMGIGASQGSSNSATDQTPSFVGAGATLTLLQNGVTHTPEGQNINYTNKLVTSSCGAIANYTIRDTLPSNVSFVSATNGGTYNAGNRVVSWTVNQAAGTTVNYNFVVSINAGAYYAPVTLLNEPVAGTPPTLPSGWTASSTTSTQWVSSAAQSHSAPNSLFALNLASASDEKIENTAAITLPATPPNMTFWGWINSEPNWDGGVVEISTNGGTTWSDLGANMTSGGYNGTLNTGSANPLTGRAAFTGNSGGFNKTTVNLTPYANQNVKFRFRFGSDGSVAATGWYVDDILIQDIAHVDMRSSLFNASNVRQSFSDSIMLIDPPSGCVPQVINTQPSNTTVCSGTPATFSVVAAGTPAPTYQWQLSTTGAGGPWSNLTNGAPYSNVTTATLTVNPAAIGMNGYQYRCVVSGCAAPINSNPAILTVVSLSVGGTVTPASQSFCGAVNTGVLTLAGNTGSVIRWEFSTDGGTTWTPIANTTNTYTFTNVAVTTQFRAVVQVAGCATANSSAATVSIIPSLPMTIVADPGTTLCVGDPTRLTVMEGNLTNGTATSSFTSGNGNYVITFNFQNNNATPVTVTDISALAFAAGASNVQAWYSATSTSGSPGTINNANGWFQFGSGSINAIGGSTVQPFMSGLTLSVPGNTTYRILVECETAAAGFNMGYATIAAGTYTFPSPTGNCSIITGTNIGYGGGAIPANIPGNTPRGFIGSVTFTGGSGLTPVTTGTFLWTPAAGLSSTTTNPVAASPAVTTTYTVTNNNGSGCIRTANITINVNQRPAVTAQPSSITVCNTTTATFTANGTGTGVAYQWQVSTDGGVTYTNIPAGAPYTGVNTTTLTINPVALSMNGNRYRMTVSGTCPPAVNTNGAILTVNALPAVSVTPTSGCGGVAGTNGLLLTASGANTYVWAPVTGLYTDAAATTPYAGGNTATVYAAPTSITLYTVTGTSTATGCSNTASALINYTPPAPTVTPNPVTMCLGDPAVKLKSSSSTSFTSTFSSGTVNITIPDGPTIPPVPVSYPATTSTVTVSGIPAAGTITNIRAKFNITHNYVGDLVIVLKAPNGNVFNLDAMLNKTNNPGSNFTNTVISSAGSTLLSAGTAPFTATFKPDAVGATFTAFGFTFPGGPAGFIPNVATPNGLYSTPNGVWTVAMYDAGAPDAGVLNNWSLDIDYVVGVPATPAVWSPVGGLYSNAGATIPYVAGTQVDSVWTRPTPSGVYNYNVTVNSLPLAPATPTTPMAGGNGNNMVFFNLQNTNGTTYNLNGISTNTFSSGVVPTVNLYIKTAAIAGNPGTINAGNGWNLVGTASNVNVTANTLNNVLSGLNIGVPPGATYGIGLEFIGGIVPAYTNGTGTIQTYTSNGCTIITDGNVGWGGPVAPGPPANNPRNFNGLVTLTASAAPCTSPARVVTVTVNQPISIVTQPVKATVCTYKQTKVTLAAVVPTPSYQWQVSTDAGTTWNNISNGGVYSGATTVTLTITAPPVSMNGYQYRCVVSGAAPCVAVPSAARVLTVNPLPTVVISASPYQSLLPGLTTTISSTSSPAAATYTWLRNGVVVSGATTGSYVVDVDHLGAYRLRVTDVNGCTNTSNQVTIGDSTSGRVFISPNPNSGQFIVRYNPTHNNVLPRGINIYDARGKRILTQNFTLGVPFAPMPINLTNMGSGVYWVEVVDVNGDRLAVGRVEVLR